MKLKEKIIDFLRKNKALSINGIEKEAGLASSTLNKILKGERNFLDDHLKLLLPVLEKYGFKKSENPAKVVAICNHKGGVGKTTITYNLGHTLASKGYKVLLIDMDSQSNLSQLFCVSEPEKHLYHTLAEKADLPIVKVGENIDLVPSTLYLEMAIGNLITQLGGFTRLKRALESHKDNYDYILIDCPPSLNVFTSNALVAADSLLLVMVPEKMPSDGMLAIFNVIDDVKMELNPNLSLEGILFNMVDSRYSVHKAVMEQIETLLPKNCKLYKTTLKRRAAYMESPMAGEGIINYAQGSEAAKEFKKFYKEFLDE